MPSTSRARPGRRSWATTTSRTGSGSRRRVAGRAERDLFGLDADVPVTGEQLRTLMDVRRPDTGERAAPGRRAAVRRSRHWTRRSPRRSRSAPSGRSARRSCVGGSRPRTRSRSTARLTTRSGTCRCCANAWTRTRSSTPRRSGWSRRAGGTPPLAPSPIRSPDPQLHSHVLLHAALRRDGRLVAIDSRTWLLHQREVGAAYRTELARELATLGFCDRARHGPRRSGTSSSPASRSRCWTAGQAATTRSRPRSATG